jgi:large subunit ribosomal protein L24
MNIKKGDKVIVLSGKDKGKTGTVQVVYPEAQQSRCRRHERPQETQEADPRQTPEGSILDIYVPFDASKVALIDPKTKKATRVHIQSRQWQEGSRRQ